MLAAEGESIDSIDAVFLTHEHSDHTIGLNGLTRRSGLQIFANRETARVAQSRLKRRAEWQLFETGSTFHFRDLEISNFSIPHDASDPVSFVFSSGDGTLFNPRKSVAWVTDLGYVTSLVTEKVRDADVLVLESNYDIGLLEQSDRAFSLKQRIKSRHGHLANEAALDMLRSTERPRWSNVFLAHLSKECNCVNLVRKTFAPLAESARYALEVVDPVQATCPTLELHP